MSSSIFLQPPVSHVKIGTARSIILFEGHTDEALFAKYTDESLLPFFMKSMGHNAAFVIGSHNKYFGFFVEQNNTEGKVYSFDTSIDNESLIVVADTLAAFYQIVLQLQKIWAPFETTEYLTQTAETRQMLKSFLQFCQKVSPNSVPDFWEHFAFGELGIRLE